MEYLDRISNVGTLYAPLNTKQKFHLTQFAVPEIKDRRVYFFFVARTENVEWISPSIATFISYLYE